MQVKYCNVLLAVTNIVKFDDMLLIDGVIYYTKESTDSTWSSLVDTGYADLSAFSRSMCK